MPALYDDLLKLILEQCNDLIILARVNKQWYRVIKNIHKKMDNMEKFVFFTSFTGNKTKYYTQFI